MVGLLFMAPGELRLQAVYRTAYVSDFSVGPLFWYIILSYGKVGLPGIIRYWNNTLYILYSCYILVYNMVLIFLFFKSSLSHFESRPSQSPRPKSGGMSYYLSRSGFFGCQRSPISPKICGLLMIIGTIVVDY